MDLIRDLVCPTLDEHGLKYLEDDGVIRTGFIAEPNRYDLSIYEINDPHILCLHFRPHLYAVADPAKTPLLEEALRFNYKTILAKVGRDANDGEITVDIEIPLLHGTLSSTVFIFYLHVGMQATCSLIELLGQVRHQTAQSQRTKLHQNTPKVQREVEAIIERLDQPESH